MQDLESKPHDRSAAYSRPNGGSFCYIICPFCDAKVQARIWSLAGGGKKCPCGALHSNYGFSTKKK